MIELISESRCIKCNICVNICPTNVFDRVPDAPPTIARQSDCQTCYMCELYCPVDALDVAPFEASMLVHFRQRIDIELVNRMNLSMVKNSREEESEEVNEKKLLAMEEEKKK